jgi:structure-specific recognition protein 1
MCSQSKRGNSLSSRKVKIRPFLPVVDSRYLLFVPKPTILIELDDIDHVTFSRYPTPVVSSVNGGVSVAASVQATRTFDLTVRLGDGSHAFLNINRFPQLPPFFDVIGSLIFLGREEQKQLEPYFKSHKIRIRNDLNDNADDLLKKALADESDMDEEEDESDEEQEEVGRAGGGGDDDEDEEDDEDFEEESDDDVAEEYDSNAEGSESEEDEDERPAKKAKR